MAGRCGCTSSNATGASISAGACATVTGAGTPASPAIVGVLVDPSAANNLQCGVDGLFAASAQVEAADASVTITGDGSLATPYEVAAAVSAEAGNMLQLEADGLYAKPNPTFLQGTGTLFGGALPADPNWVEEAGTAVLTTDASGFITIPIFVDLLGILTIEFCIGDIPTTPALAYIDMGSVGLASFNIKFTDPAGAAIAFGAFRINYAVKGWYA